jgi:ABC-type transport system involved in cytochrome c biogenesis permease component
VPCSRRLAPALLRVTAPLASMAGKIRRLFVAQEVEDGLYF